MDDKIHLVWNLVDAIAIINLDSCPERMVAFREKNANSIPLEKLCRISAVYGRELESYGKEPWFAPRTMERASYWGGAAGCVLSHRKAIETAREKGWRNVLIVEDDVEIHNNAEALTLLEKSLNMLTGKYILYLGYSRPLPYGSRIQTVGEHALWRIEGVLSTFAYLLPRSMYDCILAKLPTEENVWEWLSSHRAIDTFYRDTVADLRGVKIYAIQPDIVEHLDGASSIGGAVTWTEKYTVAQPPHSYWSPVGWLHVLTYPLRRLKIYLNAKRTLRRARKGGLPGYKKK